MMEELELIWRRVRTLALGAPVLLLAGFGAGEATKGLLEVPADKAVRFTTEKEVPRIHLEALSSRMHSIAASGEATVDYVTLYREHVEPVEKVLLRHGISSARARKISWPLVQESSRRGVDPATTAAILLVESEGNPKARSSVGARGLMQVMPLWIGHWRNCGRDLYDIEDNICNGTSILAWYLRSHGDERSALLGYNGCVRGTNTPNCHTYPNKIWRLREQIKREIDANRPRRPQASAGD
ncbi:MAG: lytic transglycosylase domain-containing protein [Gemmatimonadota bacterium]